MSEEDKKIVEAKATVRPSGYLRKQMNEVKKPMSFWEFLDKNFSPICSLVTFVVIAGVIVIAMILD
ncbi:MAG: hypothetical protein ACW99G_01250 [Candidatus Thorarchaeota archaeon]|jgi:hypothetical protein